MRAAFQSLLLDWVFPGECDDPIKTMASFNLTGIDELKQFRVPGDNEAPNSSLDLIEIQFQPGNFQKNFIGMRDPHLIGSDDSNAVDGERGINPQQNQCERKAHQQPPVLWDEKPKPASGQHRLRAVFSFRSGSGFRYRLGRHLCLNRENIQKQPVLQSTLNVAPVRSRISKFEDVTVCAQRIKFAGLIWSSSTGDYHDGQKAGLCPRFEFSQQVHAMQARDVQIQDHKGDLVSGVIRMANKPFQGAKPITHHFQASVRSHTGKRVARNFYGDRIILYENHALGHGGKSSDYYTTLRVPISRKRLLLKGVWK